MVETEEFEKYLVGYISEDLWDQIKTRNLQEAKDIIVGRKRDDVVIKNAVDRFCQDTLTKADEKPYVAYDVVVEMGDLAEKITAKACDDVWGIRCRVLHNDVRRGH